MPLTDGAYGFDLAAFMRYAETLHGFNHEFQQRLTDDEYQYPAEDGEKEL